MYWDALALQGDALTLYWDALALQGIAKFNSLRINEMLWMTIEQLVGEMLAGVEIEALFWGCGICTPTLGHI